MSSSAITTQIAQLKVGNVQNQADSTSIYSSGVWSFKNSTALTSVTITDAGNVGIGTASPYTFSTYKSLDIRGAGGGWLNMGTTGTSSFYIFTDGTNSGVVTQTNGYLGFSTNNTERMRIDASGNLLVGIASGSSNTIQHPAQTQGNTNLFITNTCYFFVSSGAMGNAAATAMRMNANTTTSRSINASGTINANGADYAEYMTKTGDFTIAKGEICGVNSEGKLTKTFSEAVAFMVKSTNPSYVGNDSWGEGLEADSEELEAARQLVDRIAFCGQVPVNVFGATPGQWIIPVEDNGEIKGEAVSSPSFEQYQKAVGKVIAIEEDGRARIIVKIA